MNNKEFVKWERQKAQEIIEKNLMFIIFLTLALFTVAASSSREWKDLSELKGLPVYSHVITYEEANPQALYVNSGVAKANICEQWMFEERVKELNNIESYALLPKPGEILKVPWVD